MATKKSTKPNTEHLHLGPNDKAEIVPITAATRELTPGVWAMIEKMAPVMHKAHLFGVTGPDQAAAIMLKGYELGLSITASFEFIQVIQGKPALSPRGAMALLLSNPSVKDIQIKKLADGKSVFFGYECTMTRLNGFTHTAKFTLEDAARAGLLKPDSGWAKYPENMTLWRAIGFAADVVFPDVTAGMTTLMKAPEMYGVALTQGGDVIDVPSTTIAIDPLQELVNQYGAEAVMAANDGKIPSNGDIATVRAKLEKATQ
jgi:hypothetical protein